MLAKHGLPKDVATAVSEAVASGQLPSSHAELDRLLTKVLKPIPGMNVKTLHAGEAVWEWAERNAGMRLLGQWKACFVLGL